jgi:hypothetical protein
MPLDQIGPHGLHEIIAMQQARSTLSWVTGVVDAAMSVAACEHDRTGAFVLIPVEHFDALTEAIRFDG